ncbi:hypothetical protein J0895_12490 [Phormidium pseudopriestleyi FRX01]|uniref:Uncharacterized protein n=1 Tax=Phormidium pseudopriestleyi FRX01 TaxID=1759528 RepID=A0ABS3FU95_9CYAN|nr:hypothetical protein [Phormidium pseudopriestleyi FRX01]
MGSVAGRRTMMQWQRKGQAIAWVLIGLTLGLSLGIPLHRDFLETLPRATAQEVSPPQRRQRLDPRQLWRQVYERLPDFPLENNYISTQTGEVDPDNTLANRLISYHLYVKNRLPMFRLDWKLTLADYLGVFEELDESVYPGNGLLQENPLAGDREILSQLNRQQREELIEVLVTLFNPNYYNIQGPTPGTTPGATPSSPRTPAGPPPLPQSGDADLLRL